MNPDNASVALMALATALTTLAATLTGILAGWRNYRATTQAADAGAARGDAMNVRMDQLEERQA